ncbi:MAG: site-specific DNA-methyltransferase [Renibacterium salmoninarum]|nr:site-specific DNA-methyltransferase [Renibacterium salmoninarum]
MPKPGRLTLSWVGKDQALLNTSTGGYEWVNRDDPRVTEVRLLKKAGRIGTELEAGRLENLLITGDSFDALLALSRTPEYAEKYRGKVKLVYIDPPFNTGQAFDHYDDALEHSVWLTMMRDRLLLIRDLLAPDGSVWVHLDDAEMAYCRVLMDEIFGRSNFVATVVWQKVFSPKNSARHLSVDQDYILVFAKDSEKWNLNGLPRTEAMDSAYTNPDNDPRGAWTSGDLVANKPYSLGLYSVVTPSGREIDGPPAGRYWRVSSDKLHELDNDRRVWWGSDRSGVPRLKRFLSEVRDRVPQTLWLQTEVGHNQEAKKEIVRMFSESQPFSTPKPERLLKRIIHIATNPGDIVLDCFGGSGTTAAVAHKMGRRWVTVELEASTVEAFTKPRLEKVVKGEDSGGITKSIGWSGGGSFETLLVEPSIYEVADERAFLREGLSAEDFSRSIAAQLGFVYNQCAPFSGNKGRTRLAVVDGVIDQEVVRALLGRLDETERTTIVGRGIEPEAATFLKQLSPGSRLLKAPRDLIKRGVLR